MKFDMSFIMKKAWKIEKNFEKENGEKALFSECLKEAWRVAKMQITGKTVMVKEWFLRKNFTFDEAYIIGISYKSVVEKETLKAALVRFTSELGSKTFWIPKSCLMMLA